MFKLKLKILINDILKKKLFDKSFFFAFNIFLFLIHNKSLKNMLIKRLKQVTISESVSNIVQFFIRRNFYL